MKVPVSWLKEFVELRIPIEDLAHQLTMAGLEVEEIRYVGLPLPEGKIEGRSGGHLRQETKVSGLEWDPDKIVVGAIHEVMPHPNADRLVLCRLDDGVQEQIVLTGAPNLFPYKGQGPLERPLKVAYAREGARIYDGHQPGQVLTTLKRAKIRGVESYSMACSEKELGISEEHAGVILLAEDAPVGVPLVDYMGDAVLDISLTPNLARDANILGVAREVAALTGQELKHPNLEVHMEGPPVGDHARIEIQEPELNPRFVLGLIQEIQIRPSPYEVQRRLRLAGMRPINNVVDATNYAMLEIGQPLHAFDYDVLMQRAGGKTPVIYTRRARPGERLTTLDGVERVLDDFTVLVCDSAGPLSIAGIIGGAESEVNENTRNVLLEGAAWNFINIRRTLAAQRMSSEASYRFSRGVHPAMAERGVRRGLQLMRAWTGGTVARGLVDNYPLPPRDPTVEITPADVERWLGIRLSLDELAEILRRLQFSVVVTDWTLRATAPDHRLDIGEGVIGMADLMEEIARIYGYERIPETRLADELPPQRGNPALEREERLRDILVNLGLQEVITYRVTLPEREARRLPAPDSEGSPDGRPYLRLVNPIASDRVAMRHSLLASVLEIAERNARLQPRLALFEIGPVFFQGEEGVLPEEAQRLAIVLAGPREIPGWQAASTDSMDFYDLKGIVSASLEGLHLAEARYEPGEHPTFHPGRCARVYIEEQAVGVIGELHPQVRAHYELPDSPVFAADLDLDAILPRVPDYYNIRPVPGYPPVLEDLAVVVAEPVPAAQVAEVIRQAGGGMVIAVKLFDVYRGEQAGPGQKSLAYSLTYQAPDRTLTDQEVAQLRQRIVHRLEQELGARLRA
jgi:phenylalanyl-tRNA synthetase beta chain